MNFGSWIPHLFYDLIGRITPGAVLLFLAYFVFQTPPEGENFLFTGSENLFSLLTQEHFPSLLTVMGAITAAYITGILLGGLMYLFEENQWNWEESQKPNRSAKEKNAQSRLAVFLSRFSFPRVPLDERGELSASQAYDFILAHNDKVGARLAKLNAERHLGKTLMAGMFILLICNILLSYPYPGGVIFTESLLFLLLVLLQLISMRIERLWIMAATGAVFAIYFFLPLVFYEGSRSGFLVMHTGLAIGLIAAQAFQRYIQIRSRYLMRNNYPIIREKVETESKKD